MWPFLLLAACSLSKIAPTPCETSAECRSAFGLGSQCGDDGLCTDWEVPARCDRAFPEDLLSTPSAYRDAVILGSLFEHSIDVAEGNATELAIRQVNEYEGLEGTNFGLIQCSYEETSAYDDSLSSDDANTLVSAWLADVAGAPAVIGPATSSQTEVAFNVLAPRDVLIVSPSATSPSLTYLDGADHSDGTPGLIWRTAPPDSFQGAAIAATLLAQGVQRVGVLYAGDAYGEGLKAEFESRFTEAGGQVSLFAFSNASERDAAIASVVAASELEVVLFISGDGPDIEDFLVSASVNFSDYFLDTDDDGPDTARRIFLSDAARDEEIYTNAANRSASAALLFPLIFGSRPAAAQGTVYNTFAAAYTSQYNASVDGAAYAAHTYDATWLAIYGVAWGTFNEGYADTESGGGLALARGLRQVSDTSAAPVGVSPISWLAISDAFKRATAVNIDGASGPLDFDPTTEETVAPIEIWDLNSSGEERFRTTCCYEPDEPTPLVCRDTDEEAFSCPSAD